MRFLIISVIALLLAVSAYWYQLNLDDGPKPLSRLARTVNACESIAEKAAMKLPEVLPFQQLEKAARKTRVFETCMGDRGYQQNPDWVKYGQGVALTSAKANRISQAEAYELFRRESMLNYAPVDASPAYWVPAGRRKVIALALS